MSISFLHCSDLHLGFTQFGLEERFADFGQAFREVAETAIAKQVQYLLIAGDIFNKRSINSRTLAQADQVFTLLKKAKITVIAIEGNHDKAPYGEGDSWLAYLRDRGDLQLLQPEFSNGSLVLNDHCVAEFPGIRIIGLGYMGSMTARRLQELQAQLQPSAKFTVLMLHAAVDMLYQLGGIKRADLDGLEGLVDYVALGHIHGRYELEDWIYNPGSPESWDLGEFKQEKGYYHVVIDSKDKQVNFLPSSPRPIYDLKLDLTDLPSPSKVAELCVHSLQEKWDPCKQDAMLRLVLRGEVPFNPLAISQTELLEALHSAFPLLQIEILNDTTLRGSKTPKLKESQFNRAQIEALVLEDLLKRNFASYDLADQDFVQAGISTVQAVKELAIAGEQAELLTIIKNWTKKWGKEVQGDEDSAAKID